jgi:hypothetical protein
MIDFNMLSDSPLCPTAPVAVNLGAESRRVPAEKCCTVGFLRGQRLFLLKVRKFQQLEFL